MIAAKLTTAVFTQNRLSEMVVRRMPPGRASETVDRPVAQGQTNQRCVEVTVNRHVAQSRQNQSRARERDRRVAQDHLAMGRMRETIDRRNAQDHPILMQEAVVRRRQGIAIRRLTRDQAEGSLATPGIH